MERFLDYFKPDQYLLELYLFRKKRLIRGTVIVLGEVQSNQVRFHAASMKIKSVSWRPGWRQLDVENSLVTFREEFANEFTSCSYIYDGEELKIPLTSEMQKQLADRTKAEFEEDYTGTERQMATFKIEYEAPISSNMQGCYLSSYNYNGEKQEIITTQFESHYAREAFPCIDEPAAKATFGLVLLTPDIRLGDVVLTNMPLVSKDQNRYTFMTTPRMSTYLLAWVVGPLKSVSTVNEHGVRVTSYCALNQSEESLLFANRTAARTLDYYDQKFGEKYPLPKLDQVALPDFEAGAMENWGLVTYRESMMLAGSDASLGVKRMVATTVTHELSHQWFGDLVTMEWWDDLWLNESFATIMEYYAADALYPELGVWEDFFTGDCLAALKRDALPGVQAVQQSVHHPAEIATLFDGAIVYAKGARLILMLIRLLGEDKFDQGLRYYFDKHKYRNTIGDDLWQSLQPQADFDIKQFMHAWLSQPGYPMLEKSDESWRQQRFLIAGAVRNDPTKQRDGDSSATNKTTSTAQNAPATWPLPKVKDDMSGHYLLDLSAQEFAEKLAQFDALDMEQKLRLLIDHMLLAKAGQVENASLLDLIPKFVGESSSAVWEILANIIGDLKLFCPPETESAKNYKKFLRSSFAKQFQAVDLSPLSDSNALALRNNLLSVAYYAEDEPTLRKLEKLYQADLSKLDADLRSHILGAKFYFSEAEVFDRWLEIYQSASDPELKQILLAELAGYSKDEKHCQRMLELLQQPEIVRPQDHIYLYIYLLRNFRTRERALVWLTENWDYLVSLTGDKSTEDYPRYAANLIRTPEEAKTFHAFCEQQRNLPILKRTLEIGAAEIKARLKLIKREQPSIEQKLQNLV